ncbi:MAG: hypothetical protein PHN51_11895 [Candidatus Nanopelagicales bacterium]|nr:hypothetical protein [Candidatus Nanopelagicales bacterium]
MIRNTSADLGASLAHIAHEKKLRFAPISGTLMAALCGSMLPRVRGCHQNGQYLSTGAESLPSDIVSAASGDSLRDRNNAPSYAASSHDALMDNYIQDYTKLIGTHVLFAQRVVYAQMTSFMENVRQHAANIGMKQPEDLFRVTYMSRHAIFDSALIESEAQPFRNARGPRASFDYRAGVFTPEFDLLASLLTGDSGEDDLIKSWYAENGDSKLKSYMAGSDQFVNTIVNPIEMANYQLVNFLFFRGLVNNPTLQVGLSLTALTSLAVTLRNSYAEGLMSAMDLLNVHMKNGTVLIPGGSGQFSYMSDKGVDIFILEENFQKAAEQGFSIDHIFGHVAASGNTALTLETLESRGAELKDIWNRQRSLFGVYTSQRWNERMKEIVNFEVRALLDSPEHMESMKEFYQAHPAHRAETLQLCAQHMSILKSEHLEDLAKLSLFMVAKIIYRHSNAFDIISGMLEAMKADPELTPSRAVVPALTKYLTDYLMAQLACAK